MLAMPGIGSGKNGQQINRMIDLCSERGDCFRVIDLAKTSTAASATLDDAINTTMSQAIDQATGFDDSYRAAFWPWVRVKDSSSNELVWVPPSVAAYAAIRYNDKVAHPWFAAAGFKRGVLDFVTEARMKLTKDHRDSLYEESVNPIATIKDQVLIFGNRTTQKKNTSLRSLDVRRGMIDMKKLIVSIAQFVLFDKNTIRSRDEFVGKITPVLETMQSQ
jgi:phage tail sheath protein FI